MLIRVARDQEIDLRILRLDGLIPHEETIPTLLRTVYENLVRAGRQKDPIVVDPKSSLVLDGMHRLKALRLAKAKFALCACFDYLDDRVILQRWLRYFARPRPKLEKQIVRLFGLVETSDYRGAARTVDQGKSPIALISRSKSYLGVEKYDIFELYRRMGEFDSMAEKARVKLEFRPDSDGEGDVIPLSETEYAIYPIPITKRDVIRAAETEMLFPYKTTRHILPIRPMGINFPLGILQRAKIDACRRILTETVSARKVELVREGFSYENRTYSEQLAIFSEMK